jgi:hypothetical protein
VDIAGELDATCTDELRLALAFIYLIVDMTETTSIDPSALKCLVDAKNTAQVFILWAGPEVVRLIDVSGAFEGATRVPQHPIRRHWRPPDHHKGRPTDWRTRPGAPS